MSSGYSQQEHLFGQETSGSAWDRPPMGLENDRTEQRQEEEEVENRFSSSELCSGPSTVGPEGSPSEIRQLLII